MAKRGRKAKTTYDKVNELDPGFASEVFSLKDDQLNDKLALMAKHRAEIEEAKTSDESIKRLREELKVAGESYSEPLKGIKLKTKLVIEVLKERGKV
jgi:hypothetical protein